MNEIFLCFLDLFGLLYLSKMHRKCVPTGAIISAAHHLIHRSSSSESVLLSILLLGAFKYSYLMNLSCFCGYLKALSYDIILIKLRIYNATYAMYIAYAT